ncbi:hypothetical protein KA111_01025 [Candidatus Woesebacteria bacterium]|nr:hypothetical protein [Candidatus Woesebacteria bacterium]
MNRQERFVQNITQRGTVLEQFVVSAGNRFSREPLANSIENLERYRDALNQFLKQHEFNEFRIAELPTNLDGSFVMHTPSQLLAVEVVNEHGKKEVRHTPLLFKREILKGMEYEEVPPVQQIAENLFMVTFAMDPGPPLIGEAPKQLLMSIIMEKKSLPASFPVCLTGNSQEMQRMAENSPSFESIRLTQEQFDFINAHYQKVEAEYDGKRIPLSPNLIVKESEQSNVMEGAEGITFSQASDKFYSVVVFKMKDGSTRTRLINRSEVNPETQEIHEGSTYTITTNINGEAHIMVIQLNRLNGQAEGFEGIAYELPRGFNIRKIINSILANYILENEVGITSETSVKIKSQKMMKSDTVLEDVHSRQITVQIPDELEFNPTGSKSTEPLKNVEQLVPTWMKIEDTINAIRDGHSFTDSFSIAMLGTWLFENEILTLKETTLTGENISDLSIAMEVVQNWRDGGEQLTIWRDDPNNFDQHLECPFSRNSGIHRDHHNIGFANNETTAETINNSTKPWRAISIFDAVEGIRSLRWDNVTIAVLIKMLLQKEMVNINLAKLKQN